MTCPNCSSEGSGNYCTSCGQSLTRSRITWKYFLGEIQQRIFGFDNKFARTVKDLTIRPEKVIQSVIDGIQVRYFGPLGYYFLLITIWVILISILNVDMAKLSEEMFSVTDNASDEGSAAQAKINQTIFEYFRLISLLMLPFFILGNYLIFRNKKFNFLENGVLVIFAMGHPLWLSIFFLILLKYADLTLDFTLLLLVGTLYYCWVCARFYSGNRLWNFVKGFLAQMISFILMMVFIMITTTIYLLLFPEAAKTLAP